MPRTERMVRMQPTTRTKFCRGVDAWLSFTATLTDSIELLQQGGPLRLNVWQYKEERSWIQIIYTAIFPATFPPSFWLQRMNLR